MTASSATRAPAPPSSSARQIRGSSLFLVGRVLAVVANLVVQVLVVRSLSQAGYGAFAYAVATVNFLAIVVGLGMDQAIQRFGALYDEQGAFDKLVGALVLQVAVIGAIGALVIAAVLGGGGWLESHLIDDPAAVDVLQVLVLLAPVLALDAMMLNLFAVYGRPRAIFGRRYLLTPALKVAAAGLTVGLGWSVTGLAWAWLAAGLLGLLAYGPTFRRLLRDHVLRHRPPRISVPAREMLGFTTAAVASDLVIILLFASDVVIVGWAAGTEGVATLQAVQPLATGNQLVFYALIPLFIPLATRHFAQRDHDGMAEHLTRSTVWSITLGFPVLALTLCFARPLTVTLFGESYASSAAVLAVLAVGQYVQGAFGVAGLTLKVVARLRALVVANVAVAVANIGLNVVLVPRYGAIGAAVGTTISLIALTVAKLAILRHPEPLGPGPAAARAFVTVAVAALVLGGVALVVRPGLVPALVLAAIGSLAVVARNRRALDVGDVFPELTRTRIGRWLEATP